MNFYGFTDSLATITGQPNACPHCHSAVRVSNRLCLRCLLEAGLTEDKDPGSGSLDALLSESNEDTNRRLGNNEVLGEIGGQWV